MFETFVVMCDLCQTWVCPCWSFGNNFWKTCLASVRLKWITHKVNILFIATYKYFCHTYVWLMSVIADNFETIFGRHVWPLPHLSGSLRDLIYSLLTHMNIFVRPYRWFSNWKTSPTFSALKLISGKVQIPFVTIDEYFCQTYVRPCDILATIFARHVQLLSYLSGSLRRLSCLKWKSWWK